MIQNPSRTTGGQGTPRYAWPTIPSTIELYDLLMRDIEPDLMSLSVPILAAKYRKETVEEAAMRAKRYAKAFQEYDRHLEAYIGDLDASIRKFGKEAAASMEALENAIKAPDLDADSASNS